MKRRNKRGTYKSWTGKEIRHLIWLFNKGLNDKNISVQLNRTIPAIDKRLRLIGLRHARQVWNNFEEHLLLQMVEMEGCNWKSFAYLFGRSDKSISNKYKRIMRNKRQYV